MDKHRLAKKAIYVLVGLSFLVFVVALFLTWVKQTPHPTEIYNYKNENQIKEPKKILFNQDRSFTKKDILKNFVLNEKQFFENQNTIKKQLPLYLEAFRKAKEEQETENIFFHRNFLHRLIDIKENVTSWCVMALKSAQTAKLKVPRNALEGALNWIDSVTDNHHRTGYQQKGDHRTYPISTDNFTRLETMTAAGMISKICAGVHRSDPKLRESAELLLKKLPTWGKDKRGRSLIDFYYWYYGTLAMYQMGDNYWRSWNNKMKTTLIYNQDKDGSWDIVDPYSKAVAGRVYSTALNVLSLQIYYRYPLMKN